MKNYYIISNVNDRNEFAKTLANGEEFNVWYTPGVVRHYDSNGDLISTETAQMPEDVERIDPTEKTTVYVCFKFGSFVKMGLSLHQGLTFAESLALRSDDVDEYEDPDTGKWVKQTAKAEEAREKLHALRARPDDENTTPPASPAGAENEEGENTMNYTITTNAQYKSLEISFNGKPSEAVRDALKGLRFRWHGQKKVWYGFASEDVVRAAIEGQERTTGAVKMDTTRHTKGAQRAAQKPQKTPQDHIRIYWNGIKIDGGKLIHCGYSIDNNIDHHTSVTIYARDYADLPRDLFQVVNNSDIMTDYFENDRADLTPEHPLYKYFRYAGMKAQARADRPYCEKLRETLNSGRREPWPGHYDALRADLERRERFLAEFDKMTDPGQPTAEDLAEIDRQRQEAENARRAAEHEAELREREKMLNARCNGRRLIEAEQEAHPIKEGEPTVCINWSEHPAFYAWDEDALILSLEAAENILHRLDAEQNATRETEQGHGWYYKTKFTITGKDESGEDFSYTGRYDLGDNDGGLIEHIRAFAEYYRTHDNFGHDILHPEESTDQTRFAEYLAGFLSARATA